MACGSSSVRALHLFRSSFPPNSPVSCSTPHCNPLFFTSSPSSAVALKSSSGRAKRVLTEKRGLLLLVCASSEGLEVEESNPEEIISGEWPDNFALLNYDDLRAYLEPEIFKEKMDPSALLGEVMSTTIRTTTVDQTLEEINHHFEIVSGLPVIDDQFQCIGVISKKDKQRASHGLKSKVGEVMSSPAITLSPEKTVLDAAASMLKEKIHRIPIVNQEGQVVGIVTRTDIFKALEDLPS
ncbi:PREDICTED: uncharacterized protein LOC104589153 isoform X2 [Nelumbo nucifera]|uniref:Uncharacterized protein LOC104589153 isoform X2 n=1 Tax=Nelumbo nucifera TaxID=4432 RepID=A0A1U7ZCQ4_NELNU|nr:PREDICTED: uncharacterized protein LOC104589153 isoform X2 [Nelumbo nucifera]